MGSACRTRARGRRRCSGQRRPGRPRDRRSRGRGPSDDRRPGGQGRSAGRGDRDARGLQGQGRRRPRPRGGGAAPGRRGSAPSGQAGHASAHRPAAPRRPARRKSLGVGRHDARRRRLLHARPRDRHAARGHDDPARRERQPAGAAHRRPGALRVERLAGGVHDALLPVPRGWPPPHRGACRQAGADDRRRGARRRRRTDRPLMERDASPTGTARSCASCSRPRRARC